MDLKDKFKETIDKAWEEYVDLHQAEIESGYDDAMDGFERKEAEGYALGLEAAYFLVFGEQYENNVDFDPYEYEDSLERN